MNFIFNEIVHIFITLCIENKTKEKKTNILLKIIIDIKIKMRVNHIIDIKTIDLTQ